MATDAMEITSDLIEEAERHLCEVSLFDFSETAWPILEDKPFSSNWHIEAICAHLQALTIQQFKRHDDPFDDLPPITWPEFKRLLINVPPGCMKSLLVSVMWNAWTWTRFPSARFLCCTYGQDLSDRDALRTRTIVESSWYRRHWPTMKLRGDQNVKRRYDTTSAGWRLSTSVGGRGTGEHPDFIVVDDPHTADGAKSDTSRTHVSAWHDTTLSTRRGRNPSYVTVMQRLHEDDLSGHLLRKKSYVHICLPMEYERDHPTKMKTTPLGFNDPRTEEGELLWPDYYPADGSERSVRSLKSDLGTPYDIAGQLQQRPSPASGDIFQVEWFPRLRSRPCGVRSSVRFWDIAATEGGGDATAGGKLSLLFDGRVMIEHIHAGHWGVARRDANIKSVAERDGKGTRVGVEEEGGGSGKTFVYGIKKMLPGYSVKGYKPRKSKEVRAGAFATQASIGNIVILGESDDDDEWIKALLEQLEMFPHGSHDDYVDAIVGAYEMLLECVGALVNPADILRHITVSDRTLRINLADGSVKSVDLSLARPSMFVYPVSVSEGSDEFAGGFPCSVIQVWVGGPNLLSLVSAWKEPGTYDEVLAAARDMATKTKCKSIRVIDCPAAAKMSKELGNAGVVPPPTDAVSGSLMLQTMARDKSLSMPDEQSQWRDAWLADIASYSGGKGVPAHYVASAVAAGLMSVKGQTWSRLITETPMARRTV